MSKYYIQINKDGRPLEGGVVSKTKPKYGLYQTITSWCCNSFPVTLSNDGTTYTPSGPLDGDTVEVNIYYEMPVGGNGVYTHTEAFFPGRTTFTLSELVSILNDKFNTYGHWEKDAITGVKLVESPFSGIDYLFIRTFFD